MFPFRTIEIMVSDTILSQGSFPSSFLPSQQPSASSPSSSLTPNLSLLSSPSFTPSTSLPSVPVVVSYTPSSFSCCHAVSSPSPSSHVLPSTTSSSSSLSTPLLFNSSCFCFSSYMSSSSSLTSASLPTTTTTTCLPSSSSQSFISSSSPCLLSPSPISFTPFPFSSDISSQSTNRLSLLDALNAQTYRRCVDSPQGLLAILAAQNNRHHAKSATDDAYNNNTYVDTTIFPDDSPCVYNNNAAISSPQAFPSFNDASTTSFHDINTNNLKLPRVLNIYSNRTSPQTTSGICNRSASPSEIATTHCGRFRHHVRLVECPSPPPPSPSFSPLVSKLNSPVDIDGLMKKVTRLSVSVPRLPLASPRMTTSTALIDSRPKIDMKEKQIDYDEFEEEEEDEKLEDLNLSSSTSSFSVVLRTSCDASQTTISPCALSFGLCENGEEEKKEEDCRMGGTKRSVSAPKALDVPKTTCGEDSPRDSLLMNGNCVSCRNLLSNSITGTVIASSSATTSPTSLLSPLETDRTKVGSPSAANTPKAKTWKRRVSMDRNSMGFSCSYGCGNGVGGWCCCKRRNAASSSGGGNRNYFYPPYHQDGPTSSLGKCLVNSRMMDNLNSHCLCQRNVCDMSFDYHRSFDFSSLISPEIFYPFFGRRSLRRWREGRASQRRSFSMPNFRKSTDAGEVRQNSITTGTTRCGTADTTTVGKNSSSSTTSWGSGDVGWNSYSMNEGNNREMLRGKSSIVSEFASFGDDVANDDYRREGNDCHKKSSESFFVSEAPEEKNCYFPGEWM